MADITKAVLKYAMQVVEDTDNAMCEAVLRDFKEHPEHYNGYEPYFISRDKLKDALRKALMFEDMKQQLENAIIPKFNIGQKVWFVNKHLNYNKREFRVEKGVIENMRIFALKNKIQCNYRISDSCCNRHTKHSYKDKDLFLTEDEAQKKLKELKNK